MSPRRVAATAGRILRQLHHDPRTIGLVVVVPCLLMWILKYIFNGEADAFNRIAPMILGIFPLVIMFLITSIATLRERTSGTLDRLMTQPISKLDFVFGYAVGFSLLALIQAVVVCLVTVGLLGVTVAGGTWPVIVTAVLSGFLGTTMGLLVSAFATTEFQAVQTVMPLIMPQVLLCGLFVPREHMAKVLQWIADVLPVTYSVDAMKQVATVTTWTHTLSKDLVIVAGYGVAALVIGSVTIRRQE